MIRVRLNAHAIAYFPYGDADHRISSLPTWLQKRTFRNTVQGNRQQNLPGSPGALQAMAEW